MPDLMEKVEILESIFGLGDYPISGLESYILLLISEKIL